MPDPATKIAEQIEEKIALTIQFSSADAARHHRQEKIAAILPIIAPIVEAGNKLHDVCPMASNHARTAWRSAIRGGE